MKIHAKNPLTAASFAGSLLFFLASAGTPALFADEMEDYDYTPPSRKTTTSSYTDDATYFLPTRDRVNHLSARAFFGVALEDDLYEGDGCALNIVGASVEWAHTVKGSGPRNKRIGADFIVRADFGYGHDDFDVTGYVNSKRVDSVEYTVLMWNVTGGVNFVVDLPRFRFYAGPRVGLSVIYGEQEIKYYYGGSEAYDESNAGFAVRVQGGWDIRITERSAITLELGYLLTTALPDGIEDQSFLTFGVGYRHSF